MAESKVESGSKGDGVFVTGVLLLVSVMLLALGFGGLGGATFSPLALLLLLGAGGFTYFALKAAQEFGMEGMEGALWAGGMALTGALAFIVVFARGYPVLSSIAVAVVLACAAPIVALAVRGRTKSKAGGAAPSEPAAV